MKYDPTTYEVQSVQFTDDGIAIGYIQVPDDIRVEGRVFMGHTLHVAGAKYGDELVTLQEAVQNLLVDVLEDWHTSTPYVPDDETDDDAGMGVEPDEARLLEEEQRAFRAAEPDDGHGGPF